MNSASPNASERDCPFGLRLPDYHEITGLTADQALALLTRYWISTGDEMGPGSKPDWACTLTYDGLVVLQAFVHADKNTLALKGPYEVRYLLEAITNRILADLVLDTPTHQDFTVDGMVKHLAERGCGAVQHSNHWKIGYVPLKPAHPWDVAQAYVFHRNIDQLLLNSDEDFQVVPGSGALRDQLLSLSGFALETGHLLHLLIYIAGPSGWDATVHAWEIGLVGYKVEIDPLTSSGPSIARLQRVEDPDRIFTEATAERTPPEY